MQADAVIYNGKTVLKEHFRVFVKNKKGEQKLVNSWEAYKDALASGVWFDEATARETKTPQAAKKPNKKKAAYTDGTFEVKAGETHSTDAVFEVDANGNEVPVSE